MPHPTPYTLHHAPYTLHLTPYTLRPKRETQDLGGAKGHLDKAVKILGVTHGKTHAVTTKCFPPQTLNP